MRPFSAVKQASACPSSLPVKLWVSAPGRRSRTGISRRLPPMTRPTICSTRGACREAAAIMPHPPLQRQCTTTSKEQSPTCQGLAMLQGSSRVHSSQSTTPNEKQSAARLALSPDITSGACTRQHRRQEAVSGVAAAGACTLQSDKSGLAAAYQPAGVRRHHAA